MFHLDFVESCKERIVVVMIDDECAVNAVVEVAVVNSQDDD